MSSLFLLLVLLLLLLSLPLDRSVPLDWRFELVKTESDLVSLFELLLLDDENIRLKKDMIRTENGRFVDEFQIFSLINLHLISFNHLHNSIK